MPLSFLTYVRPSYTTADACHATLSGGGPTALAYILGLRLRFGFAIFLKVFCLAGGRSEMEAAAAPPRLRQTKRRGKERRKQSLYSWHISLLSSHTYIDAMVLGGELAPELVVLHSPCNRYLFRSRKGMLEDPQAPVVD